MPAVLGRVNFSWLSKTVMPAVLVCAIGAGIERLRHKKIDFLLPDKIKTAARIDTVCFDKTGTLTGSNVSTYICHRTSCSACLLSVLDCSMSQPCLIARPVLIARPIFDSKA